VVERAIQPARRRWADARLMRAVRPGLYEMTPDQTGIVQRRPPASPELHVNPPASAATASCNGPIAGQLMAEMLVHGRAVTMDAAPPRPRAVSRAGEAHVEPLTFV